jgi:hypothetical protein
LLVLFMLFVVTLDMRLIRRYWIKLRCLLDFHVFLILMRG